MAEIPPIGLPNLISQGDMLARARSAQIGADTVGREVVARELERLAERRAEQVQRLARVEGLGRRGRERRGKDDADEHGRFDRPPEDDDDDEPHLLDVSA